MKNLALLIFTLLTINLTTISQPCLPNGITFTTQTQIDSFQITNPNCTEIEGDVKIYGGNITNLNGLNVLTSIGGDLIIGDSYNGGNPSLTSLTGLNNVTSIGGALSIMDNDVLINLTGLENLFVIEEGLLIGTINIQGSFGNPSLTSLNGLESLLTIGGDLEIQDNEVLTSLSALNNLTSIGGFLLISVNDAITNFSGLDNVTSIGGGLAIYGNSSLTSMTGLDNVSSIGGYLEIYSNDALLSLIGLDNVDAASILWHLYISNNNSLSTCEAQSVCEYLAGPGADAQIYNNAPGCNSVQEVEDACWTAIEDIGSINNFAVSPNPFDDQTIIEFNMSESGFVKLSVIDYTGSEIQKLLSKRIPAGIHQFEWKADRLPSGTYFLRLELDRTIETNKVILMR